MEGNPPPASDGTSSADRLVGPSGWGVSPQAVPGTSRSGPLRRATQTRSPSPPTDHFRGVTKMVNRWDIQPEIHHLRTKRGVASGLHRQPTRHCDIRKELSRRAINTPATSASISCRHEMDPSQIPHLAPPWSSATNRSMSQPEQPKPRTILLPHPDDVAARKALAAMPPAPLERVLRQATASRKFIADWRAKGLPDLPLPHHLRQ